MASFSSTLRRGAICVALFATLPALAQSEGDALPEDDAFDFDDLRDAGDPAPEEDAAPAPDQLEEGDELEEEGDPSDEGLDDFMDDTEDDDGFNLLDDEEETDTRAPGVDTAGAFRRQQTLTQGLPADEAVGLWEGYLAQYPNTMFRKQISDIMESLMDRLYDGAISGGPGAIDALDAEIDLMPGLLLENINPRSRFQAGFELGFPEYLNLMVDYEHAFRRDFSVHAGVRNRYSGFSIEPGVRWAMLKSTKSQTLVTFLGDLHINTNPAFVGIRPQFAFGKRFGDTLELQLQAGVDLEFPSAGPDLRILGGGHIGYKMSPTVGLFVESRFEMKNFNWDGGVFSFNTLTFGMRFFPSAKSGGTPVQASFGGTVPHSSRYWRFHEGSFMAQTNVWLD